MMAQRTQVASSATPTRPIQAAAACVRRHIRNSVGQPLDGALRRRAEARLDEAGGAMPEGVSLGYRTLEASADRAAANGRKPAGRPATDFSSVRLHADGAAASAARHLGARAFTIGEHVYANPALLPASPAERDGLIAHELAHVAQQRQLGRTMIQPRLIATGSNADIQRFFKLAEPAMGELLQRDAATGVISSAGPFPTTRLVSAFAAAMHRIIDDRVHDAEVAFGVDQPGIAVGRFPDPPDLTGMTRQTIDIDDIEAIEAGSPGHGLAALTHELIENYEAHRQLPLAGGSTLFPDAHQHAFEAEGDVTEEVVGPGRPVAESSSAVGNQLTTALDHGTYYLVVVFQSPPNSPTATPAAPLRARVTEVRRASRVNVLRTTIDRYVTDSTLIPAIMMTEVTQVRDALIGNPLATARIEGFTDNVGSAADNRTLSYNRAEDVMFELEPAVNRVGLRVHLTGAGEARPVAPNDTAANRARNRRVEITVDQPAAAAAAGGRP